MIAIERSVVVSALIKYFTYAYTGLPDVIQSDHGTIISELADSVALA